MLSFGFGNDKTAGETINVKCCSRHGRSSDTDGAAAPGNTVVPAGAVASVHVADSTRNLRSRAFATVAIGSLAAMLSFCPIQAFAASSGGDSVPPDIGAYSVTAAEGLGTASGLGTADDLGNGKGIGNAGTEGANASGSESGPTPGSEQSGGASDQGKNQQNLHVQGAGTSGSGTTGAAASGTSTDGAAAYGTAASGTGADESAANEVNAAKVDTMELSTADADGQITYYINYIKLDRDGQSTGIYDQVEHTGTENSFIELKSVDPDYATHFPGYQLYRSQAFYRLKRSDSGENPTIDLQYMPVTDYQVVIQVVNEDGTSYHNGQAVIEGLTWDTLVSFKQDGATTYTYVPKQGYKVGKYYYTFDRDEDNKLSDAYLLAEDEMTYGKIAEKVAALKGSIAADIKVLDLWATFVERTDYSVQYDVSALGTGDVAKRVAVAWSSSDLKPVDAISVPVGKKLVWSFTDMDGATQYLADSDAFSDIYVAEYGESETDKNYVTLVASFEDVKKDPDEPSDDGKKDDTDPKDDADPKDDTDPKDDGSSKGGNTSNGGTTEGDNTSTDGKSTDSGNTGDTGDTDRGGSQTTDSGKTTGDSDSKGQTQNTTTPTKDDSVKDSGKKADSTSNANASAPAHASTSVNKSGATSHKGGAATSRRAGAAPASTPAAAPSDAEDDKNTADAQEVEEPAVDEPAEAPASSDEKSPKKGATVADSADAAAGSSNGSIVPILIVAIVAAGGGYLIAAARKKRGDPQD